MRMGGSRSRARVAAFVAVVAFIAASASVSGAAALNVTSLEETLSHSPERWTYWSNTQLTEFVQGMERGSPDRCKAYTIGESAMGQSLWVLSVTKVPGVIKPGRPEMSLEGVPAFLYVGNMHGDEPLGRQLMFYLAEELCAGAAEEPAVDRILSSGVVHLLFSLNPDGFDLKTRGNANGVDLNRNFPDAIKRKGNLTLLGTEEPESEAIARYAAQLGTTLVGATLLHEGALVVNYPLDGAVSGSKVRREANPSVDDALFRYLAQRYIDVQPELQRNPEFPTGKVQGSMWYPVYGGLQDYLYLGIGAYCTTVEMNDQKWPDEVDLPRFWKQHRASMYAFLDAYLSQGITVRFRANEPGDSVVVKAAGASLQVARAFLDLEAGEEVSVHFPVPTGAYKVAAEWHGDDPQHPELAAAEVEVRPDARASLTLARPLPAARGGPMRVAGLVELSDASSSGPSLVGTANGERREEGVPPSRPGERNYRLNVQGGMTSDRQQPLRDAVLQNLKNRVESTHNASWKRSHRAQEILHASYFSSGLMVFLFVAIVVLAACRVDKAPRTRARGLV